jgi:hypothetical protein
MASPEPSIFCLDPSDLPPLVAPADSRIHGNGPGSNSWFQDLDISLDVVSDPWMPTYRRISSPSHHSTLNSFGNAYGESPRLIFGHSYNDSSAIPDAQRTFRAGDFRAGFELPRGCAAYHCSLPNVEASASPLVSPILVMGPMVCSPAYEQSGSGLNFDSRGPTHDFGTYWPSCSPSVLRSKFGNTRNETQRSNGAPMIVADDRKPEQSARHIGTRTPSARLHNKPGATESIIYTGEMFFDLNMQSVQPRKLRKKNSQERESYLNVRKHGACEKHKLAKRVVSSASSGTSEILRLSQCHCKNGPGSSNSPRKNPGGNPPGKRQKLDVGTGTPPSQSRAFISTDIPPSPDCSLHDRAQPYNSSLLVHYPAGLVAPLSRLPPGANTSPANIKVRRFSRICESGDNRTLQQITNFPVVPSDTLIFACPYPLTGCKFLSLTCSEWTAHVVVHQENTSKGSQDIQSADI